MQGLSAGGLRLPDGMYIGGRFVRAVDGGDLEVLEPATALPLASVPRGKAADVDRAVAAAVEAQRAWAKTQLMERCEVVRGIAARIRLQADRILDVEVRDTGNCITPMQRDIDLAIESLEYFAAAAPTVLRGETIPGRVGDLHLTLREPYGVVARIVPFNHPFLFATAAIAAPLVAGNAVIIKPPEQSPLSALVLSELLDGLVPPGLVNVVTGLGSEAGDALVRHRSIKRIAFTGSVPTGQRIQAAAAAAGVKHVTLELGGKNPMIVFPDADFDRAADAAVAGMNFTWQGQSCGSTSRLLLHESIHDRFLNAVAERIARIRLGAPTDPTSMMGPLNSEAHHKRVLAHIAGAHEDGAELITGGKRPVGSQFERGYWLEPTLFAGVTPEMRIAREEVFGPVLSVMRWQDLDEVVEIANGTEFGLTASVWTASLGHALELIGRIEAGYVWINGVSKHHQGTPFGGRKASGVGREESAEELLSYTETKAVHIFGPAVA